MLLDSEWHARIGLPWTNQNLTPFIKTLVLWRFLKNGERGPWWDTVERNEKSYDRNGRLTFNQSWHQLKQKKQGIFGYGYSSTLSPIQGYRHPWVMNKREFIEAYNRIMDDIAPSTTIPDDRIRISSILSNITSVIGPVALATSFIPRVSIIGAADKLIGIAATVTGLPQTAYDHFENKYFLEELPFLKKVYEKEMYYRNNEL